MKGDFSRTTFDRTHHYSGVRMQQGRVSLDADGNEQTDILLHYLRTLAADLIGPHGGPATGCAFGLGTDAVGGLTIGAGRYYVDGILVENEQTCLYASQPHLPLPVDDPLMTEMQEKSGKSFFVYLDVWERHLTYLDVPLIREAALGGPDTSSRAQVVWQVKANPARVGAGGLETLSCTDPLKDLVRTSPAMLAARGRYRGAENHFYRVEIHTLGTAGEATFKWSRDNGSVVAAWRGTDGNDVLVESTRGFSSGNWVELIDDGRELLGLPGTLLKVVKVQGQRLSIDPTTLARAGGAAWSEAMASPKVRRWDQVQKRSIALKNGAVPVVESTATKIDWIDLEDGIQVQFAAGGTHRTGDYWTIPARVATESIEWPQDQQGEPRRLAPFGIAHHYAPLGYVRWQRKKLQSKSCLCAFSPLRRRGDRR